MKCVLLILRQLFGCDSTWPGSRTCCFLLSASPSPSQNPAPAVPSAQRTCPPDNQSSQNVNLREQRFGFAVLPIRLCVPGTWRVVGDSTGCNPAVNNTLPGTIPLCGCPPPSSILPVSSPGPLAGLLLEMFVDRTGKSLFMPFPSGRLGCLWGRKGVTLILPSHPGLGRSAQPLECRSGATELPPLRFLSQCCQHRLPS